MYYRTLEKKHYDNIDHRKECYNDGESSGSALIKTTSNIAQRIKLQNMRSISSKVTALP